MAVTLKTLQDVKHGAEVVLHCQCCGNDYGADADDYFWMDPDQVFTCEECGNELVLATRSTGYSVIESERNVEDV